MSIDQIEIYANDVKTLIEQRLRVKASTLETALSRSGRLLPKWAQRDGTYLVHAQTCSAHPKLHRMIDAVKLRKAHRNLVAHLKSINPTERRMTQVLGSLGVVSFNLILLTGGVVSVLIWRGFV